MFPLRDHNPTLGRSLVTLAVIGANLAVWAFVQHLGSGEALARSLCELGAVPGELLHTVEPGTRVPLGDGLACVIEARANWYTPLTSMFLHGGWFHLLGNMWFLYVFGDNVEDAMGGVRFLAFYLICGLVAVAVQVVSSPHSAIPMVGASGAIGGVMGAYALLYPRVEIEVLLMFVVYVTRVLVPAWAVLGLWFVLQLAGGLPALSQTGAGVAFWAHVGGFLAGLALARPFCDPKRLAAHRALMARELPRD